MKKILLFALFLGMSTVAEAGTKRIAVGEYHACQIDHHDDLFCWGDNSRGELGVNNGYTGTFASPIFVMHNVLSVAVAEGGGKSTCAIVDDQATHHHKLYCWGDDVYGQLGDNITGSSHYYIAPQQGAWWPDNAEDVAVGLNHVCATFLVSGVSHVYCAGDNTYGQLGIGSFGGTYNPTQALYVTPFEVSAGRNTTCADAQCWGQNDYGQLGDGTTTNRATPTNVASGASTILNITTSGYHTCGIRDFGGLNGPDSSAKALACWGKNTSGQLGDLTTTNRLSPVNVAPASTGYIGAYIYSNSPERITIDVGREHTCAWGHTGITSSYYLYCWGYGYRGQLGLGGSWKGCALISCDKHNPTKLPYESYLNVDFQYMAVGGDTTISTWGTEHRPQPFGDGSLGQSGDTTYTSYYIPGPKLFVFYP